MTAALILFAILTAPPKCQQYESGLNGEASYRCENRINSFNRWLVFTNVQTYPESEMLRREIARLHLKIDELINALPMQDPRKL